MVISRWKIAAGMLAVSLGGLAVSAKEPTLRAVDPMWNGPEPEAIATPSPVAPTTPCPCTEHAAKPSQVPGAVCAHPVTTESRKPQEVSSPIAAPPSGVTIETTIEEPIEPAGSTPTHTGADVPLVAQPTPIRQVQVTEQQSPRVVEVLPRPTAVAQPTPVQPRVYEPGERLAPTTPPAPPAAVAPANAVPMTPVAVAPASMPPTVPTTSADNLTPASADTPALAPTYHAPLRLYLRMGTHEPRFEIKHGDTVLLKVTCERVEVSAPPEGMHPLAGLHAHGKVRFSGPGVDGVCDTLSVGTSTGEIILKGNVLLRCRKGKGVSELTGDKVIYQLAETSTQLERWSYVPTSSLKVSSVR